MTTQRLGVLVVGRFHDEAFATHIAETLVSMGHRVVQFDPGPSRSVGGGQLTARLRQVRAQTTELFRALPAGRAILARRLLRIAGAQPLHLAIVCHDFLLPAEVAALKRTIGGPVVMWFPDHMSQFGRAAFINAPYDVLFFKDPFIVFTLRRESSARLEYLPECCNPVRHKTIALSEADRQRYACDITTAGNIYPSRVAVFSQLADFDVRIWGNPPPAWLLLGPVAGMLQHRFVANEEKSKAFCAAKVVVNNLHPAEVWGINVRAFEVCAVGALQVVTWRPGLQQLFADGREVFSYRDIAHLRELLPKLLRDDQLRADVSQAGMRRALADHTYTHRLTMLLETALQGAPAFPLPNVS
jgi:spore maturation protein CgeB